MAFEQALYSEKGFRDCVVAVGLGSGLQVETEYVNVINKGAHDLAEWAFFDKALANIKAGSCDGVLASPPCSASSRARGGRFEASAEPSGTA